MKQKQLFTIDRACVLLLLTLVHLFATADVYVARNGINTDIWPHDAWSNAASNIQDAVNAATNGATIWVQAGTYTASANPTNYPGSSPNVVYISKPLILRSESGNPADTIIDGEDANRCVAWNASGTEAQPLVLDGFTVRNGFANEKGGGILFTGSGCTLRNCLISDNRVTIATNQNLGGGGIFVDNGGYVLSNCTFRGNMVSNTLPSDGGGGGGHLKKGGRIDHCLFESNSTYNGSGGGLLLNSTGSTEIRNTSIVRNTMWQSVVNATRGGGGLENMYGAKLYLWNCLIADNEASAYGKAIYNMKGSTLELYNCTVSGNGGSLSDSYGAVQTRLTTDNLVMVNSIVHGNMSRDFSITGTNSYLNYSCFPTNVSLGSPVGNYVFLGAGNLTNAPGFVDAAVGNYHLSTASSCLNMGTNQLDWMIGAKDLVGNPRIDGSVGMVDMGCYEYVYPSVRLGTLVMLRSRRTWLVEAGAPRAEIVVAATPARMTTLAAQDLQTYIEKISGAILPIVTEPTAEAHRIYVGVSPHTEALGLSTNGLAYGAYRMASGPNWLALLGPDKDFKGQEPWPINQAQWDALNPGEYYGAPPYARLGLGGLSVNLRDDGGTYNAVCDFLRELGVRWYFPGELGEIVPQRADIPLPTVNRIVTPDFPYRDISYWSREAQWPDVVLWTLRQGGFAGQELHGTLQNCHGLKWLTMRDEVKQAHPEWYALIDGERATNSTYAGAPCLSSEGLSARALKFARWLYDARNEPIVNLDPPDGFGGAMCQCEECVGKNTPERGSDGSMSDYVFDFANRAATELYQTHPDRKVSVNAYSSYSLPPEEIVQFSPNVVLLINQMRDQFHDPVVRAKALNLRNEWLALLPSQEIYIFDHYLNMVPRYGYEGLPVYYPHLVAEDLRSLRDISRGEMIEVYLHNTPMEFEWHPLAIMHLNIYVTLRLLWDADQDLDAMLAEFYTLFYGPAAAPMKAFVEHAEANWANMRTSLTAVETSIALRNAAQAAVPSDSVYGQRIAVVTTYTANLEQLRDLLASGRDNTPGTGVRVLPVEALAGKVLDGCLDDETYWLNARTAQLYDVETGASPSTGLGSTVRVFRAGNALYFGIRCGEPDVTNLVTTSEPGDEANIHLGDFVEILFETQAHSYYRITLSPAGVLVDADCANGAVEPLWTSGAAAAVHVGTNYWSAEVRVPIAGEGDQIVDPLIGVEGRMPSDLFPWYFNVGRQRVRNGVIERLSLFKTGTPEFDEVSEFGRMWSR